MSFDYARTAGQWLVASSHSDAELAEAVIDYYASEGIVGGPACNWLKSHNITAEVAKAYRVGFSNRTLGLQMPRSCYTEGKKIRERLFSLGLARSSGHEFFRGCITVPVACPSGELAGVCGIRISVSLPAALDRDLWLNWADGVIFNASCLQDCPQVVAIAATIPIALSLISSGFKYVIAPGRSQGFTDCDIEEICASVGRAIVICRASRDDALFGPLLDSALSTTRIGAQPLASLAERTQRALEALGSTICYPGACDLSTIVGPVEPDRSCEASCEPSRNESTKDEPSRNGIEQGNLEQGNLGSVPGEAEAKAEDDSESETEVDAETSRRATNEIQAMACINRDPEPRKIPVADNTDIHLNTGARTWRIRGASRARGFESLKVNAMVSDSATGRFFIDGVDLYSARSRQGFIGACATELGTSVAEISVDIGRAILVAEQAADDGVHIASPLVPAITEKQRLDTIGWLADPNLTDSITCDIAEMGLVGEKDAALLLYLALTSRLGAKPLSVLVQSASAAGKSTLADTVAALIPPEETLTYSALTGQALYYLSQDSLRHKALFVSEDEGAAKATYAMKLLVSQGKLAIASTAKDSNTGKLATRSYEVIGPVSLVMTTTQAQVDEELANRLVVITVAESVEQTRAIHAAQRIAYSAEGLVRSTRRNEITSRHHCAQRLLKSLPVVIAQLGNLDFADHTTASRRDHDKYLSLIAASALLHQFQRVKKTLQVDGRILSYIEASLDDIALADRLAAGVLVRDVSELPPQTASLLCRLAQWAGSAPFTRRSARESLCLGDTQLKVHLARLVDLEYIAVKKSAGTVFYQLTWSPRSDLGSLDAPSSQKGQDDKETGVANLASGKRRGRAKGQDQAVSQPRKDKRSGESPIWSGVGRGLVGPRSEGGRDRNKGSSPQVNSEEPPRNSANAQQSAYGFENNDSSIRCSAYVGSPS